jgi:hypothetical protein
LVLSILLSLVVVGVVAGKAHNNFQVVVVVLEVTGHP